MRLAKTTLTSFLVFCLVLIAGIVLDKSSGNAANPSVTRTDVTHRAVDGRGAELLAVRKANNLLAQAQSLVAGGKTGDAVTLLNRVVRMELPANREADKLIADSFRTLGDIYQADAAGRKAAQFYGLAVQHMSPELDSELMRNTLKLIAQLQNTMPPVILNPSETNAFDSPGLLDPGDDDCGAAVPVTLPFAGHMTISPAGDHNWRSYTTTTPSIVRIETLSADIFGDDTNLALYGSCSGSTPGNFIQFDDDGGPGFLSLITTACMPAGTYFVDVGGFNDTETPDDFDITITQLSTCVIPTADAYEPDNELGQAKRIGFRNNGSGEGNQHGRDNKNIQHHSIFPAGDIDFVKFGLSRANWVRLETQGSANPDTIIGLSFANGVLLAVNDDKAPGELSSKLEVCLPQADWRAVAIAFSSNDTFPYDWAVDVEHPCTFENEPNGAIANANTIQPGNTIYGIHTFQPVGDNDYFKFTVTQASLVTLQTSGYDIFDVDTSLDLFNSAGALIASDEDGGDGFLSTISVVLQPGTYYVNVWSFFAGYYFPYGLTLTLSEPPTAETEPNDDCATANAVNLGDTVTAGIGSPGDYDNFKLTVPADSAVEIETTGPFGDTVITITSADGVTFVGCDDDEGDGLFSRWSCCLPAGEYCVQVKDYDPLSTIPNYTIDFRGLGTCIPGDPLSCPSTGLSCP